MGMFVIQNAKGAIVDGLYFESEESARNYLKFKNPKRKWRKHSGKALVCAANGARFEVNEIHSYSEIIVG